MTAPVAQIQQFSNTIPITATPATPAIFPMQLGVFEVAWVEVDVPSGTGGQVGFYLASSSQQIIPYTVGTTRKWIVTSNRFFHWDLAGYPDSGDWSMVGYNTGQDAHTIEVRFGLNLTAETIGAAAAALAPIPPEALSPPPA